ncbi:DUF2085 domain-containing protein [Methanobrevibacter sp.]|uniref:DUF2085 domain-containing protein n=1 Tax=Methanobrevibacter sp. TaxID=66852 RepID=UPI00262C7DB3|nr:DUF2085 domain-containing protein [uncultured Methanobrevibacter sp.]
MNIFKYFCHQKPERSFKINNYQFPVCARCTGFYISIFVYVIIAMNIAITYTLYTTLLALILIIPTVVDGTTQYFGLRESNNTLRLITGLMGGFGLMIILKTLKFMFIY